MRPRFRAKQYAAVLGVVSALTLARAAQAEDAISPAKVLFREGRALAQKGDYAAACPKFEQSLALEVGVGTQFNLADCWERIGRTASAQALFLGASASAKALGQSDREQVLRERAAALEPRIPKLVIEVASAAPKLSVKRGELPVDSEQWGKALAIDPGRYEIVAKAPGAKTWSKSIELKPGASIVTVQVPELEPLEEEAVAAAVATPASSSGPPAPAPSADAAGANDRKAGPHYTALLLGTVGIGGLVVGTVMAFRYVNANDDAKAICPTGRGCSTREIADHARLVDEATTARTWTYAGLGVGVFSLAGAATLLVLTQPKEPTKTGWVALPAVQQNGALGATVSGRF